MFSVDIIANTPEELYKDFNTSCSASFADLLLSNVDVCRECIREVLARKIASWTLIKEVLAKYAFLANVRSFVDNYISCLGFSVEDGELIVAFDPDKATSLGLPDDICSLVENGDIDFPTLSCVKEGMEIWNNEHFYDLMKSFAANVVQ